MALRRGFHNVLTQLFLVVTLATMSIAESVNREVSTAIFHKFSCANEMDLLLNEASDGGVGVTTGARRELSLTQCAAKAARSPHTWMFHRAGSFLGASNCGAGSDLPQCTLCDDPRANVNVYWKWTKCRLHCVNFLPVRGRSYCVHAKMGLVSRGDAITWCNQNGGSLPFLETWQDLEGLQTILAGLGLKGKVIFMDAQSRPTQEDSTKWEFYWSSGHMVDNDLWSYVATVTDALENPLMNRCTGLGLTSGLVNVSCDDKLEAVCLIPCVANGTSSTDN